MVDAIISIAASGSDGDYFWPPGGRFAVSRFLEHLRFGGVWAADFKEYPTSGPPIVCPVWEGWFGVFGRRICRSGRACLGGAWAWDAVFGRHLGHVLGRCLRAGGECVCVCDVCVCACECVCCVLCCFALCWVLCCVVVCFLLCCVVLCCALFCVVLSASWCVVFCFVLRVLCV